MSHQTSTNKASHIGIFVKEVRLSKNLSQRDVAGGAGMTSGYISRLEDGDFKSPSTMTLLRLARGLEISNEAMFKLAGVTVKNREHPELPVYLRAETDLPEVAIKKIIEYVELIKLKYPE